MNKIKKIAEINVYDVDNAYDNDVLLDLIYYLQYKVNELVKTVNLLSEAKK